MPTLTPAAASIANSEPLILTVPTSAGLVEFRFAPPTFDAWLRAQIMRQVGAELASGVESAADDLAEYKTLSQRQILADLLGADNLAAMETAGVSGDWMDLVTKTVAAWNRGGIEAAEEAWSGKAETSSTLSAKSGGGAGSTKRRGSGSGTSTRRR